MMYVRREPNEHGTGVSHHICETCGVEFTLCPAVGPEEAGWENCMADDCPSYDPGRDVEILFMSNAEIAREKRVVDIKFLRQRREGGL